jgi:hypothetical protein
LYFVVLLLLYFSLYDAVSYLRLFRLPVKGALAIFGVNLNELKKLKEKGEISSNDISPLLIGSTFLLLSFQEFSPRLHHISFFHFF